MNQIDKYNKTEITKLIKRAFFIQAYVKTSNHDGTYLRIFKNDILEQLESRPHEFDISMFKMNESTGSLYIN